MNPQCAGRLLSVHSFQINAALLTHVVSTVFVCTLVAPLCFVCKSTDSPVSQANVHITQPRDSLLAYLYNLCNMYFLDFHRCPILILCQFPVYIPLIWNNKVLDQVAC